MDAGIKLGAPDTDYDGRIRPQGNWYDVGPYELPSGTTTATPPGNVTASFEDGTTQGWSSLYGNAQPRVVTDVAFEGSHALRFSQAAGGHSAVGTSRQVGALSPGSTVTYHVWADQAGVTVRPFVRDSPVPARSYSTG